MLEFDPISLTIAIFAIVIGIYAIWRKERRIPTLSEISDKVKNAALVVDEVRLLVDETQEAYENGTITETERTRYIFSIIHSRYPRLDEDTLRTMIETLIKLAKFVRKEEGTPDAR